MAVNPLIDRFPRARVDYTKRHDGSGLFSSGVYNSTHESLNII
jgi:hypothetical protein